MEKHMVPYSGAVRAGTASVMASYSSVNGVLNHANAELLGYLKNSTGLRFPGFVITDYAGIDMVDADFDKALPAAINAGVDMVMLPGTPYGCRPWSNADKCPTAQSFVRDMIKHEQAGTIKMSRIDDAVRRILKAKMEHKIFSNPGGPESWLDKVGSPAHRQLAREAAQQATVLLKNMENTLPLTDSAPGVCVAGTTGHNLGRQLGGWSVKWQGFNGNDGTQGTTLWDAVKARIPNAKYDETGKCQGAKTVLAVLGESPYAEGYGDTQELPLATVDQAMIDNVVATKGRKVILVFMGGRPLWIDDALKWSDAAVAAFLPGVEGGSGVLDVLLGEKQPTGKLSVTWPTAKANLPADEMSPSKDILFNMGFGLKYE
jgi:hypothetical protein